jgi:hypothetical protein
MFPETDLKVELIVFLKFQRKLQTWTEAVESGKYVFDVNEMFGIYKKDIVYIAKICHDAGYI